MERVIDSETVLQDLERQHATKEVGIVEPCSQRSSAFVNVDGLQSLGSDILAPCDWLVSRVQISELR